MSSDVKSFSSIQSPYTGASLKPSLREWHTSSGDADSDDLSSIKTLNERARDLVRNTPIGSGVVESMVDGVIGSGLRMQSSIDRDYLGKTEEEAQIWEDKTEIEYRIWTESKDCDYTRQLDFAQLQRLAYRSKLINGDCFVLLPYRHCPMMPYDLRVQLIEAERVCNPNDAYDNDKIAGGIERDANGNPIAIHIRSPHPGSDLYSVKNLVASWQRVPYFGTRTGRRNVLHLKDINRIGQTRGVTIFAPIIDTIRQLSKYNDAELSKSVIGAMLAVFIKRPFGDPVTGMPIRYNEDDEGNPIDVPWKGRDLKLAPGMIWEGVPGEDLVPVTASSPHSNFDPFTTLVLKMIGMSIRVPYEVLINHFSSSYSAARGAILQAYKKFQLEREFFINDFNQPIYNEFLQNAIIENRITANGYLNDPRARLAWSGAYFVGPSVPQIDEVKEAKAAKARIDDGLSTWSIEANKLTGLDFKDIVRAQNSENKLQKLYDLDFSRSRNSNLRTNNDNGGVNNGETNSTQSD